jgi:ABC-type phosphate/phosphonate transport system substrate-binding protein
MFELNPQLAKKLKVLYTSPKMVSAFLSCRKDYPASLKRPLFKKLSEARHTPSARQVLTLFQSLTFTVQDGDILRPANEILDAYARRADTWVAEKR